MQSIQNNFFKMKKDIYKICLSQTIKSSAFVIIILLIEYICILTESLSSWLNFGHRKNQKTNTINYSILYLLKNIMTCDGEKCILDDKYIIIILVPLFILLINYILVNFLKTMENNGLKHILSYFIANYFFVYYHALSILSYIAIFNKLFQFIIVYKFSIFNNVKGSHVMVDSDLN